MKFICNFCNVYVYDVERGDPDTGLKPGTDVSNIPPDWKCPICGKSKDYLQEISDEVFEEKERTYRYNIAKKEVAGTQQNLTYYRNLARKLLTGLCGVYKVCDGDPSNICMGQKYGAAIGFGGAGQGRSFRANFEALAKYKLKTKLVKPHKEPLMETSFLGHKITMPVMVCGMSGVRISMNNIMSESDFQRGLVEGGKLAGTVGLSGNTVDEPDHPGVEIIKQNNGWGIPVFKPQAQDRLIKLFKRAEKANPIAIGVDLDGCGSTNWALRGKPVFKKSGKELVELVDSTEKPVIFKGIMDVEDAAKIVDSKASGLYVSNHGGRVIDYGQGVAEILLDIVEEFKDKITIMADGAVRTGFDVLKLLAIGADIALIGRPCARMSLAGGPKAVSMYLDYVKSDLRRAMIMTGVNSIDEISGEIILD